MTFIDTDGRHPIVAGLIFACRLFLQVGGAGNRKRRENAVECW